MEKSVKRLYDTLSNGWFAEPLAPHRAAVCLSCALWRRDNPLDCKRVNKKKSCVPVCYKCHFFYLPVTSVADVG